MKRKSPNEVENSHSKRLREQQMGFGTVNLGALPLFLEELVEEKILLKNETFLDIGAGCGNVLEDVDLVFPGQVWGVEMNHEWVSWTPARWENSIEWCRLEDVQNSDKMEKTTVAYMYDLCLKRLTRRAHSPAEDPHWGIQNTLLDTTRMPGLKYFISTYEQEMLYQLHGHHWKQVAKKKLPCSTNSYEFYVYERCQDSDIATGGAGCR